MKSTVTRSITPVSSVMKLLIISVAIMSTSASGQNAERKYDIEITGNVIAYAHFPQVLTLAPGSDHLIVKVNSVVKGEVKSAYVVAVASASRKRKKYRAADIEEFKLLRVPMCDTTKEKLSYFLFDPANKGFRNKSYLIPSKGADLELVPADELPCYWAYLLPGGRKK
jgi:hypothetical protein